MSDGTEQISDISETGDLKHLWLLLNHLPEKHIKKNYINNSLRPGIICAVICKVDF